MTWITLEHILDIWRGLEIGGQMLDSVLGLTLHDSDFCDMHDLCFHGLRVLRNAVFRVIKI